MARRRAGLPVIAYPDDLPIVQRKTEIAQAIVDHQVVIICGETGSGKTTQLPKICLEVGRGIAGLIGHTQPRRIAARTIAQRIAEELGSELGRAVGYKVRFNEKVSHDSYVKVMTDGILLAETQGDPQFRQYDTLIIDEAHERSLNIDFLLGYLKRLLPSRPELKLIVTSATIDPQRFAEHFGGAPILEVSGRTFPVEIRYRPLLTEDEDEQDRDAQQAIVSAVEELATLDARGDILVFLSGERDIRETAETLRKQHLSTTEVVPLYARLSHAEQAKVFAPHTGRRIVLSTNVAETSLTVPGIRYVIDAGHARLSRYDVRTKVQRLPIERISQASANQRAGRCGRTSAGVCIRLYSEEDYASRAMFTAPEIVRANLAAVILQMGALGLGEVEEFPFLEPPDRRAVRDGRSTLIELGAIDEEYRLTPQGHELAKLPLDPRIGRMILAARAEGCVQETLIIAAALSVQDPRERPLDSAQKADEAHRRFADEASDFLSFVKLWDAYRAQAKDATRSQLRKWCEAHFVSPFRMREWQDVHTQLEQVVGEMGVRVSDKRADYDHLHRALLTGLLANVGMRLLDQSYVGARNIKMTIFPGSALFKKKPEWIMAAEIVETHRLYARTVARIDPAWIEPLADHLISRTYFEPHWEKNRGQVVAFERVSLFGLPVVVKRRIDFGPHDPETSREIFIREGLVEGELRTSAPFAQHNRELLVQISELEEKSRRRDVLLGPDALYSFYASRVPDNVFSAVTFERFRKRVEYENPKALFLSREDILLRDPSEVTESKFPDSLQDGVLLVSLRYRFEPGAPDDGVTAVVPLAVLAQLDPARYSWLVPGLLLEKIEALLGTLPKSWRKNFVPAGEFAELCCKRVSASHWGTSVALKGSLAEGLAGILREATKVAVPAEAFREEGCPDHLRMNFEIRGNDGAVVGMDRDLRKLQQTLADRSKQSFAHLLADRIERDDVSEWDFGDLAAHVEVKRGGLVVPGYPALVLEGSISTGKVALRVLSTAEGAANEHRRGLLRLFAMKLADSLKYLRRNLPGMSTMALSLARLGSADDLREDVLAAAVLQASLRDGWDIRSKRQFDSRLERARGELPAITAELSGRVQTILEQHRSVLQRLSSLGASEGRSPYREIREHVDSLVHKGFVADTPWSLLAHLPRYLRAVQLRLERIPQAPLKDKERAQPIDALWRAYANKRDEILQKNGNSEAIERYRFLLEEWRVSLFAQELKTAEPVSLKRLSEQWEKVERAGGR